MGLATQPQSKTIIFKYATNLQKNYKNNKLIVFANSNKDNSRELIFILVASRKTKQALRRSFRMSWRQNHEIFPVPFF